MITLKSISLINDLVKKLNLEINSFDQELAIIQEANLEFQNVKTGESSSLSDLTIANTINLIKPNSALYAMLSDFILDPSPFLINNDKKIIDIEKNKTSTSSILVEKKEILNNLILDYINSDLFCFDYCIKIGKPNNKNEQNYKKDELENFIKKIVKDLNKSNIKAFLYKNNILLSSKDLPNNKAISYIYNESLINKIVKEKFGGELFKGVIQKGKLNDLNLDYATLSIILEKFAH